MKKYLGMSSSAVAVGTLRVNFAFFLSIKEVCSESQFLSNRRAFPCAVSYDDLLRDYTFMLQC